MITTELTLGPVGFKFRVDTDFDGPDVYLFVKNRVWAKTQPFDFSECRNVRKQLQQTKTNVT